MDIDLNKLVFLYRSKLNENSTFENQVINECGIKNKMKILVCEIDKYNNNNNNNNGIWENIDLNKLKKELTIILCKYLDDRAYL